MSILGNAWNYDLINGTIAVGWEKLGDVTELDVNELNASYDRNYSKRGAGQVVPGL